MSIFARTYRKGGDIMGKGQAISGFVMGIVGIVFGILSGWFSVIGLPIAIIGLVLSVIGGKKLRAAEQPAGIATAGLVIGIVAVVFTAIAFFTCGLCLLCAAGAVSEAESAVGALDEALNSLADL